MNIKEVFHILETEKFDTGFTDTTLYNKVMLIKLRESFSKYFFIPENQLYKTTATAVFFVNLITNKKNLNIEEVKIDIYNKIPSLTLSIKYLEPLDVIEEIKNNINKDIIILKNKIYTPVILSKIFNMHIASISKNKILNQTAIKDRRSIIWLGNVIYKRLNDITKHRVYGMDNNNDIIALNNLSIILYKDVFTLLRKVKNKNKIFGVDLSYSIEEKNNDSRSYFIKKSDYNKILDNKKYYIKLEVLKKEFSSVKERLVIINYYSFIYNKKINLFGTYIKKETVINILEILVLYKNDYNGFIDKLYNFINNNKIEFFNLDTIKNIIPFLNHMTKTIFNKRILSRFNIELVDDKISKEDTLKIIDYLKTKK